jgi:hypothetical protein
LNHTPEPLNQPIDEGCTDLDNGSQFSSEPLGERFTPLSLTKEQLLALIENLNPFLNQTQIIERLWQVKKGGSAAWKEAHAEFNLSRSQLSPSYPHRSAPSGINGLSFGAF